MSLKLTKVGKKKKKVTFVGDDGTKVKIRFSQPVEIIHDRSGELPTADGKGWSFTKNGKPIA